MTLRAFLFEGQDDVTSEGTFTWDLTWHGTYRTYVTRVAEGAIASISLETGGGALRAVATLRGRRHVASVRLNMMGTNPPHDQVAAACGADDLLRGVLWKESTWRQFDSRGKPRKNKESSARGIAQIMERWWAKKPSLARNVYPQIAWQWDYCIQAARDILTYYFILARKDYPDEAEEKVWNRTIKAYKAGAESLDTATDPKDYSYVEAVRKNITTKPWER